MQNIRSLTNINHLGSPCTRTYSTNPLDLFKMAIGKVNKFIHGSEQTYNSRDIIYEQMVKEGKKEFGYLFDVKAEYQRKLARERILKHDERMKVLEEKITGNIFHTKSFKHFREY